MICATSAAQLALVSCDHLRYTKDRRVSILIGDHALRYSQSFAPCHLPGCAIGPSIWVNGDMRQGNTGSIFDDNVVWLLNNTPRYLYPILATLIHALSCFFPNPLS